MAVPYVRTAACLAAVSHAVAGEVRRSWVLHGGSVSIPRLQADETTLAARIVRFPPQDGNGRAALPEEAIAYGGGIWTAPEAQRARIGEDRLDAMLGNPDAVAFLLYGGEPPWPRGTTPANLPARLIDDGRESAEDALRLAARDAILVDGILHTRRSSPSLALIPGKLRSARAELSTDRWPGGYAFAPDRRAALEAFVDVATGPGGFSEVNLAIRDVEHGTGETLVFPEARANARNALVCALRAAKEMLPELDAACVGQLAEIAQVREGIEAGDVNPADADAALVALDRMRVRMGVSNHLAHAIRIGRAAIGLSRPELEAADRAALATLVP